MLLAQAVDPTATAKVLETVQSASASQPALYLLVVAVLAVLYLVNRNHRDATATLLNYLDKQGTRDDSRDDDAKRLADSCHTTAMGMVDRIAAHASASDQKTTEAIARCSAAVEGSQRTNERAVTAIDNNSKLFEKCLGVIEKLNDDK